MEERLAASYSFPTLCPPLKGEPVKSENELTNQSKSELELVHLAQQGDSHAFSNLFEAQKVRIYSFCLRISVSRAEAEELTQSAFLQVFRRLSDFREGSDFSAWVYRAAVDTVLAQRYQTKARTDSDLSIDRLVELAGAAVCPSRRTAPFSRMRARVRAASLNLSTTRSWTSFKATFGRARRAVKATS
jgi:RNA polymerase sigma factor (sigma-70 family)